MMASTRARAHAQLLAVVTALAAADWAIALSLVVADVLRGAALSLMAVSAGTIAGLQAARLRRMRRAVVAAVPGNRWSAAQRALEQEWSPRVARLVMREPRLVWSVVLLLQGRRDGEQHPTYACYRDALSVWIVLGAVAATELAVTPLLPLPAWVETVLLVLGAWGLVVVLGLTAALVVHPHVIEPTTVRLRIGFWAEVALARTSITRATPIPLGTAIRGLHVADGATSLSPAGSVNVLLVLDPAATIDGVAVDRVRLWVDNPAAFTAGLTAPGSPLRS